MLPLTRPLNLVAAAALAVLTMFGVPAHAGEAAGGNRVAVEQSENGTCALLQRAISRRACLARLERAAPIDTAENK